MPGPKARTLRRRQRLTRPSDFKVTFSQGSKSVGRYMVMWIRRSERPETRLGVVASKRSIGKAHRRNRARRRLREAFRIHQELFNGGLDVVLIARPGILEAGWDRVCEDIKRTAGQVGIPHEKK